MVFRRQQQGVRALLRAPEPALASLGGGLAALLLGVLFFLVPAAEVRQPTDTGWAFTSARARQLTGAKKSGDTLPDKILELSQPASQPLKSSLPIVITEEEANSYLKQFGPQFLPPAVSDTAIHIHPDQLNGEAEVDFSKLNPPGSKSSDVGTQVLATMFKGKQRVMAAGKLKSSGGQGQLSIENVTIGSFAVPDWLTHLMVDNYLQQNYKLDLSKPFRLPDHVTQIELGAGKATFVRSANQKPPAAHSSR